MLSTILSSDGLFPNTFPSFYDDFTQWNCIESAFTFPEQGVESVFSPMQSLTPEPVISHDSGSGSDKSKPDSPNESDDLAINEKKRKRMISNRESARRSRMRKQTHLENLRNQSNRLKVENRDLMNRVQLITGHSQHVERHNQMLRAESILLRQRLEGIRDILITRQQLQQQLYNSAYAWPCNNLCVEQRSYIINQPIINHQ